MTISIIKAVSKEDIEFSFQVRKQVFCKEQGVAEHRESDKYDNYCDHWVAVDYFNPQKRTPVGAGRLNIKTTPLYSSNGKDEVVGKIERVAVLFSHRGKGIAKSLMESIESHVKANEPKITKLVLHSQIDKKEFYMKQGYSMLDPMEPPFEQEGILHYKMIKLLK